MQQCAVMRTILVRDGIIAIGDLYQAMETHVILYAIVYNFIPMHNVSSGYSRPSEVLHNNVFAIDKKLGIITVDDTTSSPNRLNYEAYNIYIFSVAARAYNSPGLECMGNIAVYVEDINEPITLHSSTFC